MDASAIIDSLNDKQRLAVSAPNRATLVLAGAGSGKTRVLVHRIAWHLLINRLAPHNILAVTFTNKAANEMRGRLENLLGISVRAMWIGTFHGLAHRLLRQHAKQAKLPDAFQVMDSDDQLRIIKRLLKNMNLDEEKWPPKQVQWFINGHKEEGHRARHLPEPGDPFQRQMRAIYLAYEEFCDRSGLVDFAELLLRAHETLRDNADLLQFYRQRFQQVLVDEFQDTNTVQYAWLRLLTEESNNLFIVGDDDQSIYGWRGAKVENLHHFQRHYPDHQVIRLEQNYRSTGHILSAANHLIANNENRLGKELWTEAKDGEPLAVYAAFNEQDEAYFAVEKIKQWISDGGLRSETAILYRSNAQSRQFEERLMTVGMPYRVYGGLRFFERQEIKNALAYLRLAANRGDDASFERIVNTPTRGLGVKTLDDLRNLARAQNCSLWQAAQLTAAQTQGSSRGLNALKAFLKLIEDLAALQANETLGDIVKYTIEHSGLLDYYRQEKQERGEARAENLSELINAAKSFDAADNPQNLGLLDLFLAHAALEAGEAQGQSEQDCVQLMTLHAAKGLEFKLVFIVGLEDGLFPAQSALLDPGRLQEERRLCYVGLTRAMQKLYLSYAESRRLYGKETFPRPSRFIREIPPHLLQEIRLRGQIDRPTAPAPTFAAGSPTRPSGSFRIGQTVRHAKFGEGVVLQCEGSGAQERVQVNFRDTGLKWLIVVLAKLEG